MLLAPANSTSRGWLERGARFGHVAKGVIYGIIGALALQVALGSGGRVAGDREAARLIRDAPFGRFLLILLGIGLAGYALWRCVEAIHGTTGSTGHGSVERGARAAERIGAVAGGLANGALAVAVFQMALGGGGGSTAKSWIGRGLDHSLGPSILGAVGVGVIAAGLVQLYKALTKKFLEDFPLGSLSVSEQLWITRFGQLGYAARGVVFPLIGFGLVKAALTEDPSRTGGVREALLEIARSSAGQWLLGLVAVGFLAFGCFMLASARYRKIPC